MEDERLATLRIESFKRRDDYCVLIRKHLKPQLESRRRQFNEAERRLREVHDAISCEQVEFEEEFARLTEVISAETKEL